MVKSATQAGEFESIVEAQWSRVYRFALASLRDRDAAESVAQDYFLRAYLARERFRHDCSLEAWIMSIAVNLVRDAVRNRGFQFWKRTRDAAELIGARSAPADNRRNSPEAQVLLKERVAAVWSAACDLPGKQRTVFLLRFVEEMDIREIACATGLREGTVKTHHIAGRCRRERVLRTAPLWGLGQRIFLLHDGRTKDLVDAIQAHSSQGSEGNVSVDVFNRLTESNRQDILNFLRSL